jgi:hypothetical protein
MMATVRHVSSSSGLINFQAALFLLNRGYSRLGGPQGLSGQVRKISSPPGFDPRTVQPVANRYTDYATRPTLVIINL